MLDSQCSNTITGWVASERAQCAKTLTRGIALLLFRDNVFLALERSEQGLWVLCLLAKSVRF